MPDSATPHSEARSARCFSRPSEEADGAGPTLLQSEVRSVSSWHQDPLPLTKSWHKDPLPLTKSKGEYMPVEVDSPKDTMPLMAAGRSFQEEGEPLIALGPQRPNVSPRLTPAALCLLLGCIVLAVLAFYTGTHHNTAHSTAEDAMSRASVAPRAASDDVSQRAFGGRGRAGGGGGSGASTLEAQTGTPTVAPGSSSAPSAAASAEVLVRENRPSTSAAPLPPTTVAVVATTPPSSPAGRSFSPELATVTTAAPVGGNSGVRAMAPGRPGRAVISEHPWTIGAGFLAAVAVMVASSARSVCARGSHTPSRSRSHSRSRSRSRALEVDSDDGEYEARDLDFQAHPAGVFPRAPNFYIQAGGPAEYGVETDDQTGADAMVTSLPNLLAHQNGKPGYMGVASEQRVDYGGKPAYMGVASEQRVALQALPPPRPPTASIPSALHAPSEPVASGSQALSERSTVSAPHAPLEPIASAWIAPSEPIAF
jgi:hypothetical protein